MSDESKCTCDTETKEHTCPYKEDVNEDQLFVSKDEIAALEICNDFVKGTYIVLKSGTKLFVYMKPIDVLAIIEDSK